MDSEGVAVIIPCFNAERFLAATVESVLGQSALVDEIVVVDDCSTDRSLEKARCYGDRVRCLSLPANGGISAARNAGIDSVRSGNVLCLDADDLLMPIALQSLRDALDRVPEAGVAFGRFDEFDDTSAQLPPRGYVNQQIDNTPHAILADQSFLFDDRLFSPLLRGSFIPMGGALIRRSVFETIGRFDENFRVGEDRDFWLRAVRSFRFLCVNKIVMRRRLHADNLTGLKFQHLYHDFNIRHARKMLAAFPDMSEDDRDFITRRAAECCRIFARHYLSEGCPKEARKYATDWAQWGGWNLEAKLLYLLSFLSGPLVANLRKGVRMLR